MAEPISKSQMLRKTGTQDDLIHHVNSAITEQYPLHRHVVTTLFGYDRDQAEDVSKLYRDKGWKVTLSAFGPAVTPLLRLE